MSKVLGYCSVCDKEIMSDDIEQLTSIISAAEAYIEDEFNENVDNIDYTRAALQAAIKEAK